MKLNFNNKEEMKKKERKKQQQQQQNKTSFRDILRQLVFINIYIFFFLLFHILCVITYSLISGIFKQ